MINTIILSCSTREGMQVFLELEDKKTTLVAHNKNGSPVHIDLADLVDELIAAGVITIAFEHPGRFTE